MNPIIDISSWQNPKNINYDKLCASVSGVIIRATYGSRDDGYFDEHYAAFKKRGVPVGAYGFITEYMDVADQVFAFALMCEGKKFALGYWGDVEAEAGAELLTLPTIRAWLTQADAKLGTTCGIYTSWWMWQVCAVNSLEFGDRPLWVAHYHVTTPRLPVGWNDWRFHQYSSTTFHPGYNYVLDTNRYNGDDAKWAAYLAASSSTTTPVPPIVSTPLWRARVIPTIGLNVRRSRDFSNNVIRALPFGVEVNVYEVSGTWARIAPSSEWVAARFLEKIKDGEPTPSDPHVGDGVMNIRPLCQRDYPQKLGTSNTTIAGFGCLLTSVTMLTNWLLVEEYLPPKMNDIIKGVGGFVSGNLFRFASLCEAFPQLAFDKFIRCDAVPAPLATIDAILDDNRPVIVETRASSHTTEHWVLLVGKRDGRYVCNDPWTGKQVYFEDVYGDPSRWIFTVVSYKRK